MIATDHFIFIHQPKTGGTFVTRVLFELQDLLGTEELRVRNRRTAFVRSKLKHGLVRDIPRAHRHKAVLSAVRNPYDLYVSEYEFGWWKRKEYPKYFRHRVRGFRRRYPEFPELSFERFVQLLNEAFCRRPRNRSFHRGDAFGWATERFARFFLRHPWPVIWLMDDVDGATQRIEGGLEGTHLLRTEELNRGLFEYLSGLGLPRERLEFILDLGKIRPEGAGRRAHQGWRGYYTPEFKEIVRRRERVLFRLFPDYDL